MHGEAVSKEYLSALSCRCTERQVQEEAGESLAGTMLRQIKTESITLDIQSRLQLADGRKVCLGSCSTVALLIMQFFLQSCSAFETAADVAKQPVQISLPDCSIC